MKPMQVYCPVCKAGTGQKCFSRTRRELKRTHKVRQAKARSLDDTEGKGHATG